MTACVTCGAEFEPVERHPGVTNEQWCPDCLRAIIERLSIQGVSYGGWPGPISMRANDV